jgi:hypothetical protein
MTTDTPEYLRAAGRLHAQAREFRGRFLNSVAVIEHDIAKLLTDYFCRDDPAKQELFFERIACRMSLEEKRSMLVAIVKADYPSYWEEHSSFLRDIQLLQVFRNKLAHSVLDVSDEALARPIEAGVGFIQWKAGAPVTQFEFDGWCVRANIVLSTLKEIRVLLPFKEHG